MISGSWQLMCFVTHRLSDDYNELLEIMFDGRAFQFLVVIGGLFRNMLDACIILRLKFRKYPATHTNYILSHSTTLKKSKYQFIAKYTITRILFCCRHNVSPSTAPSYGERTITTSIAIDLQSMIEDNHVGFTRDELSYMLNNVCTT